MPEFYQVCREDQIAEGAVCTVKADRTKIAICRYNGKVYALSNFCPHLTGNLGEGTLDEDQLVCPEHGWRFRVQSGRCTNMPGRNAHSFPVEIRDGWVYVGL